MPAKPPQITANESRTYGGKIRSLPVLDYQGVSYCLNCGKCCWNWKNNDPKNKCPSLGDDLKTCALYGQGEDKCAGLGNWPQPYHYVDLPPDCGYVTLWKSKGWTA